MFLLERLRKLFSIEKGALLLSTFGVLCNPFANYALADPTLLADIATTQVPYGSEPEDFVEINGVLYFTAVSSPENRELWATDGVETWLVADVNPYGNGFTQYLTAVGDRVFFAGRDGSGEGYELWTSDGSPAGGVKLDINPNGGSFPSALTALGNRLYFVANDGSHGSELWTSDGTAVGTMMVKDINLSGDSSPDNLIVVGDRLYFAANDGFNGAELWVSDGTETGTMLLKDINPSGSGSPEYLTAAGDRIYFRANNGINGNELWMSDGTATGTAMVKDINPTYGSNIDNLTVVGDRLYFLASDGTHGIELWTSDGTVAGTELLKDIEPGDLSGFPQDFTPVGDRLFFHAKDQAHGDELWTSDGTPAGTLLLKDIYLGANSSSPHELTAAGDRLFFVADDGSYGADVWMSDGTSSGTVLVKDIGYNSSPAELTAIGTQLYFRAAYQTVISTTGNELWTSDGTAAGTMMVKDIYPEGYSSDPKYLTVVNGNLYFSASDGVHGTELWVSDGTAAGTSLFANIRNDDASSYPTNFTEINGITFFQAKHSAGWQIWATDGKGIWQVTDLDSQFQMSANVPMRVLGDRLYFTGSAGIHGVGLWVTDGSAAGTMMVKDFNPSGYSVIYDLTVFNGQLYFVAYDDTHGKELWVSDGTESGTMIIRDINPTASAPGPYGLTVFGDRLYFSAYDALHGQELWVSDGTTAGTMLLKDIDSSSDSSSPRNFTVFGKRLYFSADDGFHGVELWMTDGTAAGTMMVKDINPSGDSSPAYLSAVGNQLYFSANDGATGAELWKSDGTAAGTVLVKDINPLGNGFSSSITAVGDQLYFWADDGTDNHGLWMSATGLWTSDGTEAGTQLVKHIIPQDATLDTGPYELLAFGGLIYFRGNDGLFGQELWKTDGTTGGTEMVVDLVPGVVGSMPTDLTAIGSHLYFRADDGIVGWEPWVLEHVDSGRIGDLVWNDLNANGIQEAGEPGLAGVTVNLWMNCDSANLLTTTTDGDGGFSFTDLPVGDYQLEFIKPAGFAFSPAAAGDNFRLDSNPNPTTGLDACRSLAEGQVRNALDAGLHADSSGTVPDTLTVIKAIYFPQENKIWLKADSDAQPEGSSVITASMVSNGVETVLGQVDWKADKSAYQQTFKDLPGVPETIILTSTAGGSVTTPVEGGGDPSTGNLSLLNALYFMTDGKLWIKADSDASPAGSAVITASMVVNGIQTELGQVGWKADKAAYQQVFKNITETPDSVVLRSDLGNTTSGPVGVQ